MAQLDAVSNISRFKIKDISKLTSIRSQEVLLHGIPWEVEVNMFENGAQKCLGAYLYCTKKEDNPNWTATACASIKLLPFSDDKQVIYLQVPPYVYHRFANTLGKSDWIEWDELLTKYVDNDTIQLEVKIESEDPNSLNRSILKFEGIDKSCENGCLVNFELAVLNVSNLMAARSPEFMMHGMPWYITVFKDGEQLGVRLELMQRSGNVSCQTTMSVQLVSSKANLNPIKITGTQKMQWPGSLYVADLVSWNDMLKPQNGFITDDSITLKIQMKTDKPEGDLPNANPNNVAKRRRLECSICLEELYDQDISATKCGHSFCTACIKTAVQKRRVCPLCKKPVNMNELRPLFLAA